MNGSIGEAAISPQTQQQVAPDIQAPQGQQQLLQKAVQANKDKPMLESLLKGIADKFGGESQVRVKQIETMASKIAQKRLQQRDYGIDDINDSLGGRIIVKTSKQIQEVKDALKTAGKQGAFIINKAEPVKTDDYKAFHFDITTPSGLPAEIQVHDQRSAANAVVNHDLRAVHGEKPANKAVEQLRDLQTKKLNNMPAGKALELSKVIQQMRQQNGSQPLPSPVTAKLLMS